ncbi:mucin TcMUCII [Trypanosoma cruzi]|uniref:Mucin TcMUCII n=1 Tax=Trypanosoma cruzi TaxID=5693 RepID=A0A7J6XNS6_TRYCR|nr:mucin TcMUCII [Trypanosoma cruzi]
MDQALPPPPHHRRHLLLIPRRTTGDSASSTAGMPSLLGIWDCDCVGLPSPHDGQYETEYLPLLYGRPLRYSLVIVAAYNQNKITSCFVMNIGCASRGPTIRVVCGDLLFYCYFAFVLLCALHLLLCVCVPSVRGADTTDRSRRMCMRWSLVCRSCLLLPPPSVCWCCGRAVCVCACCRGLECVSCVVCGVRCMPGCCPLLMWCALCVCLPHLSSPLLLSISLTVQISSTPLNDHIHGDDDVPSAVRLVGARPVLLPVRVCVRD